MSRVSTAEAAKLLGMPRYGLTMWIKSGKCPFGIVMHDKKSEHGHVTTYINRERLQAYIDGKL